MLNFRLTFNRVNRPIGAQNAPTRGSRERRRGKAKSVSRALVVQRSVNVRPFKRANERDATSRARQWPNASATVRAASHAFGHFRRSEHRTKTRRVISIGRSGRLSRIYPCRVYRVCKRVLVSPGSRQAGAPSSSGRLLARTRASREQAAASFCEP